MYSIDPGSALPVYEQLKRQIRLLVATGRLSGGEKLPSIRELATVLTVNPNTVSKAYGQLGYEGFVISRAGSGVFVSTGKPVVEGERASLLGEFTADYVDRAVELGFTPDEVLNSIHEALGLPPDELQSSRSSRAASGSAVKRQ
jgi:GntR family transcriptional regulator